MLKRVGKRGERKEKENFVRRKSSKRHETRDTLVEAFLHDSLVSDGSEALQLTSAGAIEVECSHGCDPAMSN